MEPLLAGRLVNFPGGEEALGRLIERHPWFPLLYGGLLSLSLLLNLAAAALAAAGPPGFFKRRLGPAPWPPADGLRLIGFYLLVFFGIQVAFSCLHDLAGVRLKQAGFGELPLTAVAMSLNYLLSLVLAALFLLEVRRRSAASVRRFWSSDRPARAAWGVVLFVLVLVPVAATAAAVQALYAKLGIPFEFQQPLVARLLSTRETWFVVLVCVFAVVCAPLVEEIFFRGVLYPTLRRFWGIAPAVLLNSAVFAAMHFHLPTFLPLFVLAVFFSLAVEWTGSLAVSVTAHALFNALNIASILLVRGSGPVF